MDVDTHGLLNYQIPHFLQLKETLRVRSCVLDASDTGTGKTYVAMALAKELKLLPFVICPKSVVNNWVAVAGHFQIELLGVANYEMLKIGKFYNKDLQKLDCPYMERFEKKVLIRNREKMIGDFQFYLPSDVLVIFDEAHRCKNYGSITSRMLLSIQKSYCKIMLLSATIADKLDCFKPFGVIFGFYKEVGDFKKWMRKQLVINKVLYKKLKLSDEQKALDLIHRKIFPYYGSRMKIKDLGDLFPSNQILSQSYMCINKDLIQEQYKIIQEAHDDMLNKEMRSSALARLIRARMKIELFKLPIMLDQIEEALDSNYSVACFVNYRGTLDHLSHYFETDCVVHGGQSMAQRQQNIDSFQSNTSRIIILNMQAGGVGISLHDLHGDHPRMSIISPTWSGQDMLQALGRIHRAGAQTPSLQRIVYCAGTYEDSICRMIQHKLANITTINDQDLMGPQLTQEIYEERKEDVDANQVVDPPELPKGKKKYKKIIDDSKKKKFVKVVKNLPC